MKHYAVHTAAGVIRFTGNCPDDADPPDLADEGLSVLPLDGPLPAGDWHVADGVLVAGRLELRTAEQIEAEQWAVVRIERDLLLADSDWVTLRAIEQDLPVPEDWRAYRQALRDITLQPDPFSIDWPTAPAEP